MTDDREPVMLAGFILPAPGRTLWTTIAGSIATYLVFGRAAANLVAIIGAILLTIILVKRDRMERNDAES